MSPYWIKDYTVRISNDSATQGDANDGVKTDEL